MIVKSVLEVFCWAGVNALFGGWDGQSWAFFDTGVAAQKVPWTAGQTLGDGFAKTLVTISVASLSNDQNVLNSPTLDVWVVLRSE